MGVMTGCTACFGNWILKMAFRKYRLIGSMAGNTEGWNVIAQQKWPFARCVRLMAFKAILLNGLVLAGIICQPAAHISMAAKTKKVHRGTEVAAN
jgi:hypothetical protein